MNGSIAQLVSSTVLITRMSLVRVQVEPPELVMVVIL